MIDAPGAMPLICPRATPKIVAGTPVSPAAVDAVCDPWPSASRAEHVRVAGPAELARQRAEALR